MHYVLYDKDFQALGIRKTYPCGSWSLTKKANEFDELVIEGMAIENDDRAMYVGLHDEYAELDSFSATRSDLKAIALSGIPETANGKTIINAIDIRQLLNNDCVIDLTSVSTVSGLYDELLSCLFDTARSGYANMGITITAPDLSACENIPFKPETLETEKATGNVWKTLQAVNSVYDCYVSAEVDFINKTVQFKVNRIVNTISVKLADFGVSITRRDATKTNRAVCYAEGDYTTRSVYYLQSDDTVVAESDIIADKVLYPAVIEVFEASTLADAQTKAIQKLYENRYKSSVEISLDTKTGHMLKDVDLTYKVDVHEYKILPVMQTYENSKGTKKIKLGRLEAYWWL